MALDSDRFKGLAGFRHALRRFLAASEVINRTAGVTPQQYQAMLAIKATDRDEVTMGDLAETLLMTPQAAVQLVDRLAKAGFAERNQSDADRRVVRLSLTRQGDELIDALAERHLEEMLRQEPALRRSLNQLKRLAD